MFRGVQNWLECFWQCIQFYEPSSNLKIQLKLITGITFSGIKKYFLLNNILAGKTEIVWNNYGYIVN